MPPDGENAYGRPYGDPYADAYGGTYGDPYGEPDEGDPYSPRQSAGGWAYGQGEEFQRAVDQLADPLSDPLPGQGAARGTPREQGYSGPGGPAQGQPGYSPQGYQSAPSAPSGQQGYSSQMYGAGTYEGYAQQYSGSGGYDGHQGYQARDAQGQRGQQGQQGQEAQGGVSPWFRPHREPEPAGEAGPQDGGQGSSSAAPTQQSYGGRREVPYGGGQSGRSQQWQGEREPQASPGTAAGPPLRGERRAVAGWGGAAAASAAPTQAPQAPRTAQTPQTPQSPQAPQQPRSPQAPGEGRAQRRRAAPGSASAPGAPGAPGGAGPAAPGHGAAATGAPAPGGHGRRSAPSHRREARFSETAPMPVVDEPGGARTEDAPAPDAPTGRSARGVGGAGVVEEDDDKTNTRTVGLVRPGSEALGGRAARRRAAQRRNRSGAAPPPVAAGTRLEARRAERARREGPAIIASRFLGEVFISAGVLMLLFVAYQLWWTNVLAGQEAGGAAQSLQDQWKGGGGDGKARLDPERRADNFAPGEGFAIIYLPKLDVRAPIAQGVSKPKVLDKGLVGHYDGQPFKTAMPWDKKGNFALAAHRNTHGEPFRYINRLVAGDDIVVETATKFYTYKMVSRLPSTSPANTRVIEPVPQGSGFQKPGRYITLTTCTPEFTSKYRLIVWGKMVEERPRSKGKPDALVE
ncbi:class E sortase [Streptomyces winkii]|uniref:class E sortase n=1 Tax=Streptomyces winkii TaxID=3051178 RepID=UPI0037DA4030